MYGVKFSHKPSRKDAYGIFISGLAISGSLGLLELQSASWITRLDHLILDTFLKYSASEASAENTVVVDIDDISLAAVGQWPWPRYRMATLIEAIAAAKPAAIGIDVLFSEPDRSSLVNVQEAFKRDFDVDVVFSGAPAVSWTMTAISGTSCRKQGQSAPGTSTSINRPNPRYRSSRNSVSADAPIRCR